jgi:hypothetical protein
MSAELLHVFALWAVTDPNPNNMALTGDIVFELVSTVMIRSYLAAVQAWHLAQGWLPPLTDKDRDVLTWHIWGMWNIQASLQHQPPRLPITSRMLWLLKCRLNLRTPFDTTVWAITTSGFWGLMQSGECIIQEQKDFDGLLHGKRSNMLLLLDSHGRRLPLAKTAELGQTQDILLPAQRSFCPIKALWNPAAVSPAEDMAHVFLWNGVQATACSLQCAAILKRINEIFKGEGFGATFGHSFASKG